MSKLNKDILYLLFKELKDDSRSLFSCLLVNRLWCETVIPILWRNPWRYAINYNKSSLYYIIIYYLSNSIKEFLSKKEIQLLPSVSNQSLLFDYLSFCRSMNVYVINDIISIGASSSAYNRFLLQQEIYRVFLRKCPELKYLDMRSIEHQIFHFPEAEIRLNSLCELRCDTSTDSAFFFGLVHICHNIQRFTIIHTGTKANHGIVKLIEIQRNLKYFEWKDEFANEYYVYKDSYDDVFLSLVKKAHTLTHFITSFEDEMNETFPPDVISELRNLETLKLNFQPSFDSKYDEALKNSAYPNLEILHLGSFVLPSTVIHIIENSGGNLREILNNSYVNENEHYYFIEFEYFDNLIRAIYENCPLIEYLSLTLYYYNDLTEFENLLNTCKKLRGLLLSIEEISTKKEKKLEYGGQILKILARSAPISIRELRFFGHFKFSLEALRMFLENWKGRPELSIFTCDHDYEKDEYKEIINKYKYDGVVKDFRCVIITDLYF